MNEPNLWRMLWVVAAGLGVVGVFMGMTLTNEERRRGALPRELLRDLVILWFASATTIGLLREALK